MRHAKLLLFSALLLILLFLPNAESRVLQLVKTASLVLTMLRGLLGYYNDFAKMWDKRMRPKT